MTRASTERLQTLIARAGDWAAARGAPAVGARDLVAALLEDGESVAAAVLHNLGVEPGAAGAEAGGGPAPGTRARGGNPAPARGPDVEALLAATEREAEAWQQPYVGSEHLLMAALRAGGEPAAALTRRGVTAERAQAELQKLLGEPARFRSRVDEGGQESIHE